MEGAQPLRSDDPLERIRAAHLAAQAPWLLAKLRDVIDFLERVDRYGYLSPELAREARRHVIAASASVMESRPRAKDELRAESETQTELKLDAA